MSKSSKSPGFFRRLIGKKPSTAKALRARPTPKSHIKTSLTGRRQRRQWSTKGGVGIHDLRSLRKLNYTVSTAIDAVISDRTKEGWEWLQEETTEPSPEQQLKRDKLEKLLRRPNPQMTGKDLLKAINDELETTGDVFIEVVYGNLINMATGQVVGREPIQMWPILDGEVSILCDQRGLLPDPDTGLPAYQQMLDGKMVAEWLADEVIHICATPGRLYGVPKLISVILLIVTQQEAIRYNHATFSGQKVPKQMVSLDTSIEDLERMLDRMEEEVDANPQTVEFLAGKNAQVLKLMDSMRDMEFLELVKYLERSILARWRIAPVAIGISEAGGAGIVVGKSQTDKYWDMIEEGSEQISEALTLWARDICGLTGYYLHIISARDEEELEQAQIDDIRLKGNILTVNEIRSNMGLEPVHWGDQPFSPMGAQAPSLFQMTAAASPGGPVQAPLAKTARVQADPEDQVVTVDLTDKLQEIYSRMRRDLLRLVRRQDLILTSGQQTTSKAKGITQEQLLAEANDIAAKYAVEMDQASKEALLDAYFEGKAGAALDLQTSLHMTNDDIIELEALQRAWANTAIVTFTEDQVRVIETSLAQVQDAPDLYTYRTLVEQELETNLWREQHKLDRIARTSINRTSNHARGQMYREMAGESDPLVTWVTALDTRVRPAHQALHGQQLKLSQGLAEIDGSINCRCRLLRTQEQLPKGVPKAEDLVEDIRAERDRANELARLSYLQGVD